MIWEQFFYISAAIWCWVSIVVMCVMAIGVTKAIKEWHLFLKNIQAVPDRLQAKFHLGIIHIIKSMLGRG